MRAILLVFLLFFGSVSLSQADIRLPKLVGDHMVLQRGQPIHIWGWADPGEAIEVSFAGKSYRTAAGADGKWELSLKKMPAGGPYAMVLSGKNRIELDDILIGDVWVCSGQSNMEWSVAKSNNAEEEIRNANYPQIRLFTVKRKISTVPLDDVTEEWVLCSPENISSFSAVGYFFGREIHKSEKVPVGLIHSSWGGTGAETWTSKEGLQGKEDLGEIALKVKDLDEEKLNKNSYPTLLYNGMINPLIPFRIKGVIWYQGENNAPRAYQYRDLFPGLIRDWRNKWGQGDFPFLFVQLANFRDPLEQPEGSTWAELREAQDMTLKLKNTGMASAIDIGEAKDIHPRNKQEVGRRLALVALEGTYGRKVQSTGPRYHSMKIKGSEVYVRFSEVGEGLKTKDGGKAVMEFQLAGQDKQFRWAEAEIVDKRTVKVHAPGLGAPVAVRFAWQDNPSKLNLYNSDGLPANPFRTDEWPGITAGEKWKLP